MRIITPTLFYSRKRVHIFVDNISFFHLRKQGNDTLISFGNNDYVEVTESPEDFSNRIREALHEN